ncbi:MAG: hypothetical protein QXJ68_00390 [Methanocellales archaeon]
MDDEIKESTGKPLSKRVFYLAIMLIGISFFLISTPLGSMVLELLRYIYPPLEWAIIAMLKHLQLDPKIAGFLFALALIYIGYRGLRS